MYGIEIDLVLASGSNLTCFVQGPKSTPILCAGRKYLGFNLWIEIGLVFSVVIEVHLIFVVGPKMACFGVGIDRLKKICG